MNKKQKKVLYRIIATVVLLAIGVVVEHIFYLPTWAMFLIYIIPYAVIGYDIVKKAIRGIIKGQVFDENFLMAVATVGALVLGEFLESVAVMLFYQIGELFQSVAVGKSRKNIAALMDIRPDYANIIKDKEVVKVDPDEVEVGSVIIVNPGEKIPIDGVIVEGNTSLDTSALTGESVPRTAGVDDTVISGCINLVGVIRIKTTKEFGESTVSKILDLVENSGLKKSKSENFITKFARYYTPAVCYGALALAFVPPVISLIMGQDARLTQWVIRALTFLVISCPCALVISIPLSFFGGIGCASKNGILIKGSNYLETLANTRYLVSDKTGTLTKGVFEVVSVVTENGISEDELLFYAAHAESASSHPISLSLKKAYGEKINLDIVSDVEEIAGHGVKATVNKKKVAVGNVKLMDMVVPGRNALSTSVNKTSTAGTAVYIAIDGRYCGQIVISDVIKETAPAAIASLKAVGIKTVMLTGDRKETADEVAKALDIDVVFSELLPEDKVSKVEEIIAHKTDKEVLAFVGDGINDAPVLSRADIGIAMGALGSDAAIEAADIVLMDDDPAKISLAMRISRKTLGIVKQNIVFALAVKFACLALGAVGIANMWIAIFADVGVMVLAVLNATRALSISK